jgi:hypothetical protein
VRLCKGAYDEFSAPNLWMGMINIDKIRTLLDQIEEFRMQLSVLISEKQVLSDSKILASSKKLDTLINEYNRLIKF